MDFTGQCFFRKGSGKPCHVNLGASGIRLQPQGSDHVHSIGWSNVELSVGGTNNKLVFFKVLGQGDLDTFYLERSKPLQSCLQGISQPLVQNFLQSTRKKSLLGAGIYLAIIVAIGLIIAGLYAAQGPAIAFLADQVPYKWERQLGNMIAESQVPQEQRIEGEALKALEAKVKELARQMPSQMQDVQVYISKNKELNAFAMPGGHIVFNLGLLHAADNIEEVLGVAGHELAHVQERHVLRGLIQRLGLYVAVDLIIGDFSSIGTVIAENGRILLTTGFSRDQEQEADNVGFRMLVGSQINPKGLISFSQRIKKEAEKKSAINADSQFLNFWSTHPATDIRIKKLSEKIEEEEAQRIPLDSFDYQSFKGSLPPLQK